ncbi:MAG TPA: hypothetical protein VG929_05900 [Actinomycetota bacterium]|nr:hypothetical protein [Actinomycetota bacterium]
MPDQKEPQERPLGEVHGSKGYGAEEDISMLAPPPDDFGVGVSPMIAQGENPDNEVAGNSSDTMGEAGDSSESSVVQDSESGQVSVSAAYIFCGLAAGLVLAFLFRDEPEILLLVAVVVASFGAGWHFGTQLQLD